MIGAKHGRGRLTVASISALPAALAGKLPVKTLTVLGDPLAMLRQLTNPRKLGTGFVSLKLAGTAGSLARTSPVTWISSRPPESSCPSPLEITQGNPPPFTPRMGLLAPTNGPDTPTIVSNSRMLWPSARALDAMGEAA